MIALVLLLLAVPPDAERLFDLGNALYAERDFSGAVAAYDGALGTGWTSAALETNLGLAHAEAGRLGYAILHTERARRLAPDDEAVRQNARLLQARLGVEPEPVPPSEASARWLADRIGASGLAVLAFALYLVVLGLTGHALWNRALAPTLRRALTVLIPILAVATVVAVGTAQYATAPRAVVVADTAVLRNAPTPNAGQRGEVSEGALLKVLDQRGTWIEVRIPDGGTGWASTDDAEVL